MLIHHDNASAHSAGIVAAKLYELRYELLPYPVYSADLAACDLFLFSNMQTLFSGKRFGSNEEIIAELEAYIEEFDNWYFIGGLKTMAGTLEKCTLLKEDYLEK